MPPAPTASGRAPPTRGPCASVCPSTHCFEEVLYPVSALSLVRDACGGPSVLSQLLPSALPTSLSTKLCLEVTNGTTPNSASVNASRQRHPCSSPPSFRALAAGITGESALLSSPSNHQHGAQHRRAATSSLIAERRPKVCASSSKLVPASPPPAKARFVDIDRVHRRVGSTRTGASFSGAQPPHLPPGRLTGACIARDARSPPTNRPRGTGSRRPSP
jgi:hypothetical protein